jgi:PAS domain S-box-containing protein
MGVCSRSRLGRRSALSRSARATRREQKPRSARATQAGYLLQGLTCCAKCGYAYYGKTIRQLGAGRQLKDFIYYRCSGSDAYRFGGERICSNSQVQGAFLETTVWHEVSSLLTPPRPELPPRRMPHPRWQAGSILLAVIAVILLSLVLRAKFQGAEIPPLLVIAVAAAFGTVILLGTGFLVRALREYRASQNQFRQMASNIREISWTIDARTRRAIYVNEAYETITGRSCQSLMENPTSYEDLIHPEDRKHVLAKLEEATQSGQFDERFRILCAHGEVRWVKVHGFPVRDRSGKILRLVGTAQEITAQKQAEDQVVKNLAKAESAWAEADALRKATLALTQDLRMDFVMDALLRSLAEIVPYTCARVLVPEGGPHWLALGEKVYPEPANKSFRSPLTLIADKSPFLQRISVEQKSVLIADTSQEEGWQTFRGHKQFRSWLCVPLVASGEFLGFLSVGHTQPCLYTQEHLRRTELLAIPAAAAIQNARLYETARIYGSELEKRLVDLKQAEAALAQSEGSRRSSEEKFQTVFRSSPIPFSITTVKEGRFLDVNAAFERRYGYSRADVLRRTVHELRIWEDPADREFMIAQLNKGGPIQNVMTRLRTKSGEIKVTSYSADRIQFEGQSCILAVSEDLPQFDPQQSN